MSDCQLISKGFGAFVAILHVWLQFGPSSGILSSLLSMLSSLLVKLSKSLWGLSELSAFPSVALKPGK